MAKDLDRSGRGLIQVPSRHLLEGTDTNYGEPQSGQLVSQLRFDPGASQIQVLSVTHRTSLFRADTSWKCSMKFVCSRYLSEINFSVILPDGRAVLKLMKIIKSFKAVVFNLGYAKTF
jgi:hypothetical protein